MLLISKGHRIKKQLSPRILLSEHKPELFSAVSHDQEFKRGSADWVAFEHDS